VRVRSGATPQFDYFAGDAIGPEVINGLNRTRRELSKATPGSQFHTIWVPESAELRDQIDTQTLTGQDAPVRRAAVAASRSEVSFIRLLLNENGQLIGQIPVSVTTWDR